ncbi:MAG: amino acid adenylation domain-containing protein [Kibdelosporangium sp.]
MSLVDPILAVAGRSPRATAIVAADGTRTTYADLTGRARAVAAVLRERVPPGARVALPTGKQPATVIGMLGALMAGRSYVPVDPAAPAERRRFVVRDAGCEIELSTSDSVTGLPVLRPGDEPATPPDPGPDALDVDAEAYLLYTSGSTGTPKGVVITHRNANAFVGWAAEAFPLGPDDQVAVHAPLHFDLPVYDIYVGLAAGATLHLVPPKTALFPQALQNFLAEREITHLYAVPSALTALLNRSTLPKDGLPSLRRLLYAGEEFRASALARLMQAIPQATVGNLYGPIETNVITSYVLSGPPADDSRVPVGRPAAGVTIKLLGENDSEADEGELVVAGDCVTPGYLGRPDLTEKATWQGFYRTGDFARRDENGVLHLMGRRDGLVKTRGYRVEIGEIEAAMAGHPGVGEVVVVPEADPELTNKLHALVVPAPGTDPAGLTGGVVEYCRERLPAYMVPGDIQLVTDLPRTSTGKVARAELPALVGKEGA